MFRPQLIKRWIWLSTEQISIEWIVQLPSFVLIRSIVIYPMYSALSSFWTTGRCIKPHLHALNTSARHAKFGTVLTILRHGTPNFRRVNLSLPHVIWQQCSKFYECRDYLLDVSLGTGKRGTVPKIWRAVPRFLARVNWFLSLLCILSLYILYDWITMIMEHSKHELKSRKNILYSLKKIVIEHPYLPITTISP